MTPELETTLKNLPDRPGVYLMKDGRGDVVYVGKAQSLRSRVRSYWQKSTPTAGESHLIRSVIDRVAVVDYTLTDSDSEAFLLEANLIKRYRPRFNVRLKDDKSYPYIKITLGDDFPRVERTRRLPADGSRYFGPYASASSVDESMNLVRRLFPFRTCTIDIHDGARALQRPCLLYHIKRCQGPCIQAISKDAYRADIAQIELFLEGRQETLVKALQGEMATASGRQEYERAAVLRDKVRAIERTMESQKMAAFARTELDLVGLARQDNQAAVQLFAVRGGKLIGRDVFLLDAAKEATGRGGHHELPRTVLHPRDVGAAGGPGAGGAAGCGRAGAVPGRAPRRPGPPARPAAGPEARAHGARPAQRRGDARPRAGPLAGRSGPDARSPGGARRRPRPARAADADRVLRHQQLPGRAVGRQHGRLRGRPSADGEYRRFRIKTVEGPNDFASHQEVLRRRFRRAKTGDEGAEEELLWRLPDLVVIDGGKGQVAAAKIVLDELGLHDLPLAGLAKEREELFLPGATEPILLPATSPALYLVQRLRDEAHRFAITYHRNLRAKARSGRRSTTWPGSDQSASASCSGCSDRRNGSGRRRSSRSPRSPASGRAWRPPSRRPSTRSPEARGGPPVTPAIVRRDA